MKRERIKKGWKEKNMNITVKRGGGWFTRGFFFLLVYAYILAWVCTVMCQYCTVSVLYCVCTVLCLNCTVSVLYSVCTVLCLYSTVSVLYCVCTLLCLYSTMSVLYCVCTVLCLSLHCINSILIRSLWNLNCMFNISVFISICLIWDRGLDEELKEN